MPGVAKSSRSSRGSRKSSNEKIYSTFKPPENTEEGGNTVTTGEFFVLFFCPNFSFNPHKKLGGTDKLLYCPQACIHSSRGLFAPFFSFLKSMTRNWLFEIDLSYKTHTLDLNSVQKFFGFDINDFDSARCLKITEKVSFNICKRSELRLHFEWTKVN